MYGTYLHIYVHAFFSIKREFQEKVPYVWHDFLISELKKKVLVQEEAISSWIEALDDKKNIIKDK